MTASTPQGGNIQSFRHAKRYFGDLDPITTGRIVASGVDVALVLEDGVIKDVAVANEGLAGEGWPIRWRGRSWLDTVTLESRDKIGSLLKASPSDRGRWRQVNHAVDEGLDVPVSYTTVRTGADGRVLALGRDLRGLSLLQQRLLSAQQQLEREYAALREAEARYRHLFNVMSEAVVIVSARNRRVHDLNPAAAQLLDQSSEQASGIAFLDLFDEADRPTVDGLLGDALLQGEASAGPISMPGGTSAHCHVSGYREGAEVLLIARFSKARPDHPQPEPQIRDVHAILQWLPDGFVVTTASGRILSVNSTFLEATQVVDDRQIIGDQLNRWLARSNAELNMLFSGLKHHGTARNFATVLRDRFGNEENVEVSGVAAQLGSETAFGFAIRTRPAVGAQGPTVGTRIGTTAQQVAEKVGKVPLKEIVREETDKIERLCIETALSIADDSRASAAEILGLSRQGLYSKLKRFGIDDHD